MPLNDRVVESHPYRRNHPLDAHDVYHARDVVGEYVQRHLGGDLWQTFHQEVRRPHPHLQRAKGMLGCLSTLAHGLRVLVEALLYGLQDMLMLPTGDPSLLASGAAAFDTATMTGAGPVTAQN